MLSSVHRRLSGPWTCLALSSTLTEEVLAAVVSGRVKKSGRGHFGFPNDCWNAVVCERVLFLVCACPPQCVCVFMRVCLLPCFFAADSHLSILAARKRDSRADRSICI